MNDPSSDSTRPTICHVLHSLHFGGAEVLARRFAVGLQSEFRPVFACLDDLGPLGEQLQDEGYPVCILDRRPGFDLRCVWRLSRWFRRQRVDLIHAHQYAPYFYSSLARWAARRIPVLFTEHGRDYPDIRRWKRVLANRFLLRRNDHVVAVGEHVRQALINNEGLSPPRIEVIYNGVSAERFVGRPCDRNEVRKELGYTEDHAIIIQVARLDRLKDHATGIRAMAALIKSHRHARLLLVGDGEERGSLESLVDALALTGVVRFLGARNDVARLLQAADVFLLTSISEGIPLTLIEAMLAGVPIVSTSVGGVPEVIVKGESGLFAEPEDHHSVTMCLKELLTDEKQRRCLSVAARRRAERMFSEYSMMNAYGHHYARMSHGRSPGQTHQLHSKACPSNIRTSRAVTTKNATLAD